MGWLVLAVVLGLAGCDGDWVPAQLPSETSPPSPLSHGERGDRREDKPFFGGMTVDTWNWSDEQLDQVYDIFERVEALVAEARDAMTTEATARAMQAVPGYSIQVARQNLRQLLTETMVLLELCDLTPVERSEWNGRFSSIAGQPRRAIGAVGGDGASGAGGGAPADVGEPGDVPDGVGLPGCDRGVQAGDGSAGTDCPVADPGECSADPTQTGAEVA